MRKIAGNCEGTPRRDFLRLGVGTFLGMGFVDLIRQRAVGGGAFVTVHRSFGSGVSWKRGVRNGLPAYMTTPDMTRSGGPNFLGARHSPFVIKGYPNSPDFKVRDVVLPPQITSGRETT